MLPGAALLSLAARFCWQGQHFRLWTVSERVSGPPPRCCQAQHFWGSTSGSGRCPSAFRGPPLNAVRRSTFEPRGSFLLAGAALQALDGARARFGAPPLDAGRGSTSGSGRCPSAFRGPPLDAARRSTRSGTVQSLKCCPASRGGPGPSAAPGSIKGAGPSAAPGSITLDTPTLTHSHALDRRTHTLDTFTLTHSHALDRRTHVRSRSSTHTHPR